MLIKQSIHSLLHPNTEARGPSLDYFYDFFLMTLYIRGVLMLSLSIQTDT